MSRLRHQYAIMAQEININNESFEVRQSIQKFIFSMGCRNAVSEAEDGSSIDLEKIPESVLKQWYLYIYKILGLPTDDLDS